MADDVYRPQRPRTPSAQENMETLEKIHAMQEMAASDEHDEPTNIPHPHDPDSGLKISGNIPPQFAQALQRKPTTEKRMKPTFSDNPNKIENTTLKDLINNLTLQNAHYHSVQLPSCGKFYDGDDGPTDGIINIRPMTGNEEQILATPKFVQKGQAINMIFRECIKENYRTDNFLTIDRTYLLIYLRGISYSPEYEVQIKCNECEKKFETAIDLNSLYAEACPDDFGPELSGILPTSKYKFKYKLARGIDENKIQEHRDNRVRTFGAQTADDTLHFRTSQLLEDVAGITDKKEIQLLLKHLPINDLAYIRNCINEPPFGIDTSIEVNCPMCMAEFEMELPLEANFFFPRKKKMKQSQV